jgi:hypothetical protein
VWDYGASGECGTMGRRVSVGLWGVG